MVKRKRTKKELIEQINDINFRIEYIENSKHIYGVVRDKMIDELLSELYVIRGNVKEYIQDRKNENRGNLKSSSTLVMDAIFNNNV